MSQLVKKKWAFVAARMYWPSAVHCKPTTFSQKSCSKGRSSCTNSPVAIFQTRMGRSVRYWPRRVGAMAIATIDWSGENATWSTRASSSSLAYWRCLARSQSVTISPLRMTTARFPLGDSIDMRAFPGAPAGGQAPSKSWCRKLAARCPYGHRHRACERRNKRKRPSAENWGNDKAPPYRPTRGSRRSCETFQFLASTTYAPPKLGSTASEPSGLNRMHVGMKRLINMFRGAGISFSFFRVAGSQNVSGRSSTAKTSCLLGVSASRPFLLPFLGRRRP